MPRASLKRDPAATARTHHVLWASRARPDDDLGRDLVPVQGPPPAQTQRLMHTCATGDTTRDGQVNTHCHVPQLLMPPVRAPERHWRSSERHASLLVMVVGLVRCKICLFQAVPGSDTAEHRAQGRNKVHHSSELPAPPPLSSHRFLLAASSASVAASITASETRGVQLGSLGERTLRKAAIVLSHT